MSDAVRALTTGRAIPMPGNDIDTDRIIPARYLKNVTFDGLGEAAFIDERAAERKAGRTHPFDDARYAGGSILVVGRNFGCGSSREHAPQALQRFGIRALVGESFAEIFAGTARCWASRRCVPRPPASSACRRWWSRIRPRR